MSQTNNQLLNLLGEQNRAALRRMLDSMNVADIAEELEALETQDTIKVFRMLSKDKAADVFSYLEPDVQQSIVEAIADREISGIIDELFLDDAVEFIEEMPAGVVKRVLANVTPDRRESINHILQYPEDSAGSIMAVECVDLKSDMTVADAFAYIRKNGADKENIYTCYVTDHARKLIGMVSAKDLLLADQGSTIGGIMETSIISAQTHDDKEEVMNNLRKYGFMSMPVVDSEERLVGFITFDDAFTILEEEATEDFEKMAAMLPSEEPYLKTGILKLSKHRIPWLLLLMIFAAITGAIMERFENSLAVLPVLVAFIPMLMNTGGNAGTQSTTLIIRGMALDEIKPADAVRVFGKETLVSLLCGVALCFTTFVSVLLFGEGAVMAMTVSLAMLATLVLSNIIGSLLTFGAKAVKMDPAVMAAPLLTNIIDAAALVVYFSLAKVILHI